MQGEDGDGSPSPRQVLAMAARYLRTSRMSPDRQSSGNGRPYLKQSIAQLEGMFAAGRTDRALLRKLEHELGFRVTERAARLRSRWPRRGPRSRHRRRSAAASGAVASRGRHPGEGAARADAENDAFHHRSSGACWRNAPWKAWRVGMVAGRAPGAAAQAGRRPTRPGALPPVLR